MSDVLEDFYTTARIDEALTGLILDTGSLIDAPRFISHTGSRFGIVEDDEHRDLMRRLASYTRSRTRRVEGRLYQRPTPPQDGTDGEPLDRCIDCRRYLNTWRGRCNAPYDAERQRSPWMPPEGCTCCSTAENQPDPECRVCFPPRWLCQRCGDAREATAQ